jgi:hypothetical protein
MEWTVDSEKKVVGKGDLVYSPPDTLCFTRVVGDEEVQAVMIYEPRGYEYGLERRLST